MDVVEEEPDSRQYEKQVLPKDVQSTSQFDQKMHSMGDSARRSRSQMLRLTRLLCLCSNLPTNPLNACSIRYRRILVSEISYSSNVIRVLLEKYKHTISLSVSAPGSSPSGRVGASYSFNVRETLIERYGHTISLSTSAPGLSS